jgi:hypothetical protein
MSFRTPTRDKRWVCAKCRWGMGKYAEARRSQRWPFEDRYREQEAEAYARRALMPARLFRAAQDLNDHTLADVFKVPVEKVALRRAELSAGRQAPRPGRLCADLWAKRTRSMAERREDRRDRLRRAWQPGDGRRAVSGPAKLRRDPLEAAQAPHAPASESGSADARPEPRGLGDAPSVASAAFALERCAQLWEVARFLARPAAVLLRITPSSDATAICSPTPSSWRLAPRLRSS